VMPFVGGHPPGPHAGDMSPYTETLRPAIRLTVQECRRARRLRRNGHGITEIASRLGVPHEEIRLALATIRTPKRPATRGTLNVTVEAREFILDEAQGHEPCWETVDRLLVELAFRRAMAGAPMSRGRQS
jgi:hypothetical protein